MHRFSALFLLALFLFYIPSMAQRPAGGSAEGSGQSDMKGVFGVVRDGDTKEPLPYATVAAWQNSQLVDGGISDIDGRYQIELEPGTYTIIANFTGYLNSSPQEITLNNASGLQRLQPIFLQASEEVLQAIEVEGEVMEMQLSLDKKIFNVTDNLASKGGTATDILDNVPSVSVDVEGNVSLRGSDNVRILVNGKPSGLTGANALRQLPADLIERIEVITNPSARYEAQGMAGIINIVLKKNQRKGLNGSVDVTTGYPYNFGLATNLNFRRDKMNYFVNLGSRYRESPGGGFNYTHYNSPQLDELESGYIYEFSDRNLERDRVRKDWSHNIRFGADFYITEKDVLTGSFLYNTSFGDNESNQDYTFITNEQKKVLSSARTELEDETDENLEWTLDYKRSFKEKNKSLSATANFRNNVDDESANFVEIYRDGNGLFTGDQDEQRSSNFEKDQELTVQLDYVDPFDAGNGQWETGYRLSSNQISNEYKVEVKNEAGNYVTLAPFSANFKYDEYVHAAYLQGGYKVGNWSFQGGLRGEYTKTEAIGRTEPIRRDYVNLFPSLFANYRFSDRASIQASYSRRIRRPNFRRLNPFFSFSDSRSFRTGNPNLRPEYTDSYEIGYLRTWNKITLTTSLFSRFTTEGMEYIRVPAFDAEELEEYLGGGQPLQSLPVNASTSNSSGLELVLSADLTNWWTINGSTNIFYAQTNPFSYAYSYLNSQNKNITETFVSDGVETWGSQARISSRQKFKNGLNFQQTLFYRSPQQSLQGSMQAMTFLSLAGSQEIWKNKGTLTLSVDDVLNMRKWRSETSIEGVEGNTVKSEFQWRRRSVTLSLNYLINQDRRNNRRDRNGRGNDGMDGGDMGDM